MGRTNRKSGLALTPTVFGALHKALVMKLKEHYGVSPETLMDYQLYGYNYYDEEAPSIKKLILDKTGKWVNGKYLYNKHREWKNGANPIRMTREFVYIYFNTLGHRNVNEFLKNSSLSDKEIAEQIGLEKPAETVPEIEYYVGYYTGEIGEIINNRLTLFETNLKVIWEMVYWEKENTYSEYYYEGRIQYQQNGMSLIFNSADNPLDRSMFIGIFCDRQIKIKPFLVGGYCGYDKNRDTVMGEIVFQRVATKEEQYQLSFEKKIDPIISQYIGCRRWTATSKHLQRLTDLSASSKYAHVIEKFVGEYSGIFTAIENGAYPLELSIKDSAGNSTLNLAGYPMYKGFFLVHESGQLLLGRFVNTSTNAPLFISLEVLQAAEHVHQGDLMGVSRFDKSFSGKVFISNNTETVQQFPKYRSSELTSDEIRKLPNNILSNLKTSFKESKLTKHFAKEDVPVAKAHLKHLKGTYKVVHKDVAHKKTEALLALHENGSSTLTAGHLVYKGQAMICEGWVLSIYFSNCNGLPHCGQIMCKVGRKPKKDLDRMDAKWFFLDENFEAKTSQIAIIP
ncbi:MAG: hypothetical protein AB3N16_02650 [Flavobacteriaceae bacterium]